MEKPKVLVVDDIPANLYAMEQLLNEMDCEVVNAQSGKEALGLIERNEFALVLLDIMMPGMDGYQVAEQIRDSHTKSDLPIIFITADTGAKPLGKFLAAGVVGELHKPVDPVLLKKKVSLFLKIYKQRKKDRA